MPRPWHSISARPFLFVFHPRPRNPIHAAICRISKRSTDLPTSKTYRISNRLKKKTGIFSFSTLKAFPRKFSRRNAIDDRGAQIGHDFLSLLSRTCSPPRDRSWVVQLVNCPRGFRHGTLGTAINTDNPHETYTRLPTRGVIGSQKVGAQLCATWSIQSRPLWKR